MPLPVLHSFAGYSIYRLSGKKHSPKSGLWAFFFMFLANLPDFDFLPGILMHKATIFHRTISHSLGGSLIGAFLISLLYLSILSFPRKRESINHKLKSKKLEIMDPRFRGDDNGAGGWHGDRAPIRAQETSEHGWDVPVTAPASLNNYGKLGQSRLPIKESIKSLMKVGAGPARTSFLKFFSFSFLALASHTILDYLSGPPRGVAMFWPLNDKQIYHTHGVFWSKGPRIRLDETGGWQEFLQYVFSPCCLNIIIYEAMIVLLFLTALKGIESFRRPAKIHEPVAFAGLAFFFVWIWFLIR